MGPRPRAHAERQALGRCPQHCSCAPGGPWLADPVWGGGFPSTPDLRPGAPSAAGPLATCRQRKAAPVRAGSFCEPVGTGLGSTRGDRGGGGGREVPSPADPGPPPGRGGRPWTPRTNTGEVRHRAGGRERGPCSPEPLDFGVRPLLTTGRCRQLRARARGPGRSLALPLPRWPVTLTLRHFFNLSELRVHFCQMEAIARPRGPL